MPALLIPADSKLASAVVFEFPQNSKVEFQFPPKITGDNRRATWKENTYAGQVEPIMVHASSGPREVTMQITYIYDGNWDSNKIKTQVRLLRGYFQRVKDLKQQRNLAILLKLWSIGGESSMSFRMKSCDVKYSETMIFKGKAENAYPLRTDITCDLASWTKGTASVEDQPLEGLRQTLIPEWY